MFIKIISQIINCIGTGLSTIGINSKEKSKTLIFFALGNTCVATSLELLGAYSGMIIQIIFQVLNIVF